MAKQTVQDKYAAYIEATYSGKEVESKTRKHRVFEGTLPGKDGAVVTRYFFLGKSGAVRMSSRNSVSESISVQGFFQTRCA